MKFLITFIILSIVNVVFSTIRSITTIKSGKTLASIISGAYFAFYNIMLIYTVADFPMWQKCIITFVCNLIGVFVVKLIEEKLQKVKLLKVEFSIKKEFTENVNRLIELAGIPHNYFENVGEYSIFNVYCSTREQSESIKEIIKK